MTMARMTQTKAGDTRAAHATGEPGATGEATQDTIETKLRLDVLGAKP